MDISQTLAERGSRYGDFEHVARLTQTLYQSYMQTYFATHGGAQAQPLPPYIAESVHMICNKLARSACGDPLYDDNYRDIAGYSQLVVDILNQPNP